jgi:hypothetical protein
VKALTQRAPHGARLSSATPPPVVTVYVPAEYDNQAAETLPASVHVAPAGNRKQRRKAAALARKR